MWGTQGCPERGWWREGGGHKRLARPLAISDERRRLIAPFLVADTCGQIQLCHSTKAMTSLLHCVCISLSEPSRPNVRCRCLITA